MKTFNDEQARYQVGSLQKKPFLVTKVPQNDPKFPQK